MPTVHRLSSVAALVLATSFATACAMGGEPPIEPLEAEILALSTYEASLGSVIELHGQRFPAHEEGTLTVVFEGEYAREDRTVRPVSLEIGVQRVDAGTLRWTGFGPYAVPFDPDDRLGTFTGTVRPRLATPDGGTRDGPERLVELTVLPSVVVRELAPLDASCGDPALRALGGLPYRLRVQALGFTPISFTYEVTAPALDARLDSVRHMAAGAVDVLGEDGDFVLPQVPEGLRAYGAIFNIEARDASGQAHRTLFSLGVHRPLEVFYDGNVEVAEVFAPVPVSGCIPGGEAGRDAAYDESTTETRERSFGVSWNETWLRSITVGASRSRTSSRTEQNSVSFSSTDGQTFDWSVGTTVEASGGVSLFSVVELGMGGSVTSTEGGSLSHSETSSASATRTVGESETTTDTASATDSRGASAGEEFQWRVSSSEQLRRGFSGVVIAGTQGVFYRQTLRLLRRASVVAYNQCGAAEVVGEVDFQDWTWSPDLALGEACPPLPTSNLPPAQCLVGPCAEGSP